MVKRYVAENKVIYLNDKGLYHREDGPAIDSFDGTKEWMINGRYHREDGPAVEWAGGKVDYWFDGKYYPSKEDWEQVVKLKAFI